MALEKLLRDFERALNRLREAYELASLMRGRENYEIFRDSAIQRFEFTTEVAWKSLKSFLQKREGITCRSPKSCVREFFSAGYLNEEDTRKFLKAIDDRNLTFHTYHEEVAEEIFSSLGEYVSLFEKVLKTLKGV